MLNELYEDLKYAEERIAQNRLLAWSTVSDQQDIAGINMLPLTAKAWVDLKLVGNKFICKGEPNADDAMEYIWRNSKDYTPHKTAASEKQKRKIGYIFAKQESNEILQCAYRHINDAFTELPVAENVSTKFKRVNKMPEVEGIIGAIDEVSARYGQNPADVLMWPLNRVFQLQKAMRVATIPGYKLAEPQLIKIIKQEILTELNDGTKS